MKKRYLLGLCAASMLLMTSCEKDNLFGNAWGEKEGSVNLTVALPEMGVTRAYGEGKNATRLQYAVFRENGNELLLLENLTNTAEMKDGKASIEIKLEANVDYQFAFWADANGNSPYSVDINNHVVKVNGGIGANSENNDAFYGNCKVSLQAGTNPMNVTLVRPFAQLNIGTSDFESTKNSGFAIAKTKVKVQQAYTKLNLLTGEATDAVDYEFSLGAIPTGNFPVAGESVTYTYLSMNYLLMTADKETTTVTFTCADEAGSNTRTRSYSNVPLQRNWRTNIYGDLMTNGFSINVTISPNFADQNGVDDDPAIAEDNKEWHDQKQN